jgi:putative ABC transport system permease protein
MAIGLNTAVFTFVNAILLRGLPFAEPARIVSIATTDAAGRSLGVSRLDFLDWRDQIRGIDGMAAFQFGIMNVADGSHPAEMRRGPYCTSNLFSLVGLRPMLGRDFTPDDERQGAEPAIILGHALWSARYAASPDVIGQWIRVNGTAGRVIGVMPPSIHFPNNSDLWMSWAALPTTQLAAPRQVRTLGVIGRVAPQVTIEEARSELQIVGRRLGQAYPATNANVVPSVQSYHDDGEIQWLAMAQPRARLLFLSVWGAVAAVLLVACANVASLLLLRGSHRSRELSIRLALGAGRWRIARQLLVESAALASIGAVLGLALSVAFVRAFGMILSTHPYKPAWLTFDMEPRVFWYAAFTAAAAALLSGVVPAIQMSRVEARAVEDLGHHSIATRRTSRWVGFLTIAEIALTIVLLAAAGLMLRSFLALYTTDVGVDTSHLMTMSLYLPLAQYRTPQSRVNFFDRLRQRFGTTAGVEACALAANYPLAQTGPVRSVSVVGQTSIDAETAPRVVTTTITADFFSALGARFLAGRAFDPTDEVPGHIGAIVNERFAAMMLSGQSWIGRQIALSPLQVAGVSASSLRPLSATIVGVVPNIGQHVQENSVPMVYLPYHVEPQPGMFVVVRTRANERAVARALQAEMRAEDPDVPLMEIQRMDQLLARASWPQRVFGAMFTVFAALALGLSAIGLYAGISYTVARRTSEIGVRMALGATPSRVVWMVARRSVGQLAVGLPLGIAGAFAVGRALQSSLVRTSGHDPATILGIAAVMLVVSFAACVLPARRATRLDPLAALRME